MMTALVSGFPCRQEWRLYATRGTGVIPPTASGSDRDLPLQSVHQRALSAVPKERPPRICRKTRSGSDARRGHRFREHATRLYRRDRPAPTTVPVRYWCRWVVLHQPWWARRYCNYRNAIGQWSDQRGGSTGMRYGPRGRRSHTS